MGWGEWGRGRGARRRKGAMRSSEEAGKLVHTATTPPSTAGLAIANTTGGN
eukprot:COSAG02_NODE_58918_length_276_cov_0.531073_1_plen_50_part_10